jgi:acetyltransferase-like isoleucine patch superfamily enzyme
MSLMSILKSQIKKYYDPHEAFIKKIRKQGAFIGKEVQIIDKGKFLYEPWCAELIEIYEGAIVAAGVRFVSHDSSYANIFGSVPTKYGKIIIERNVYIGVNSIVLPGVRIGEYSLIGAGTIVNKDIPARSVVVGNPARVIGSVDDGLARYKSNADSNTNKLTHFIDVGGSNRQIVEKYGHLANAHIVAAYKGHLKAKGVRHGEHLLNIKQTQ